MIFSWEEDKIIGREERETGYEKNMVYDAVIAMFGMVFFYPQSACGEGNTQDETTTINFLNGSSEKIDYYDGSCRTDERTSVYVLAQIIMPVGTEEAELSIKTSKNSIVLSLIHISEPTRP